MTHRRLPALLSLTFALGVSVLACGSEGDSLFGNGNNGNGNGNNGNDPEGTFTDDPLGPNGAFAACANSAADTRLTPANLVMYDKSGSMGAPNEHASFNPAQRWNPMRDGMTEFLADKRSSTMSASLQFFPQGSGMSIEEAGGENQTYVDSNNAAVCNFDYSNAAVKLTSLTQSNVFLTAINNTRPGGGTPTLPALKGAIKYAKEVAASRPEKEKTVVVLVTDGEPGMVVVPRPGTTFAEGCPNNNIATIASEARAAFEGSPSISTYLIGVGTDLTSMNTIAAAGGTEKAHLIDLSDPSKIKGTFQNVLEQIRSQNLTCDFTIPSPPDGQTLEFNAVNVVFERSDEKFEILQYSSDCSNGQGWKYDDPNNPQNVTLCPTTCSNVQSDAGGKLKLAFGCATKGEIK